MCSEFPAAACCSSLTGFNPHPVSILTPLYTTPAGIFEVLLGPEDAVISDSLNHASIIDGIRLCKAKRLRCVPAGMQGTLTYPTRSFLQFHFDRTPLDYIITYPVTSPSPRYDHLNMVDLEAKLHEARDSRIKMVVTDGACASHNPTTYTSAATLIDRPT